MGCILTILYILLILPTMLLYRSLDMQLTTESAQEEGRMVAKLKYPSTIEGGKAKEFCL